MFDMSKCLVHDYSNGVDIPAEKIEFHSQQIVDYMIDNPDEPFCVRQCGNSAIICIRYGNELQMFVTKNYTFIQPLRDELIKYRHSQKQMREIVDKLPAKIL